MIEVVGQTRLSKVRLLRRGKVRDIYDLGDRLLLVATDRVSAFDRVLPTPIPDKGRVLTQISEFWFRRTEDLVPNHLISTDVSDFPVEVRAERAALAGRSMLVKKAIPIEAECVVRGFLSGSGWQEYKASGTVGGEPVPEGLVRFGPLPRPAFTPAVKRHEGHDENISFAVLEDQVGRELADRLRNLSFALYDRGRAHAASQGLILADTKFEFGWVEDQVLLIDELFTPDSSRYWMADSYRAGREPDSADKQIVRNYVSLIGWDGSLPAPSMPDPVVAEVRARYLELYRRITGRDLL